MNDGIISGLTKIFPHLIKVLEIVAWPFVAILAIYLFKGAIRSFLRSARLEAVSLFGVKIKITGADLAELLWVNFSHFKPTEKQWAFLIELAAAPAGLPKPPETKLAYKTDLRPLRNAGLMTGNASSINKSTRLEITPLGKFLVSAKGQDVSTAKAKSINPADDDDDGDAR